MRAMKGAVSFLIVFSMLAATVVCAAVVNDQPVGEAVEHAIAVDEGVSAFELDDGLELIPDVSYEKGDLALQGATAYAARMHAPKLDNPYYYSDKNIFYKTGWGMPNCTAYAWGRAYEILKTEPKLCIYDAYQWYDYNKTHGYYKYGQTPKLGAIACWKYIGYNSGHVAVVEKIIDDTVYYSNSAWGGQTFYVNTSPVNNPAKALSGSQFLGFIYIGDFQSTTPDTPAVKGDVYKITSADGVNMRKGAGTSYSIVGAIPYGVQVTVTKTQNAGGYKWGYTTYQGTSGWFVTNFATLISSAPTETKPATQPTTAKPTQASTAKPTQPAQIMGDVDLDGQLSVMDATLIQMVAALTKTLSKEQAALADLDKDGQISIIDSTQIRLKLAGL
ncbi:MAG: CHAP domain-containing protein [Ruminococcus sp.]|nr:CHAP domain-containing protein [Ruminococcus sp.]